MTNIYDDINNKRIVIWGIGFLQTDLEGLGFLPEVLYYVDDYVLEENVVSVLPDKIFTSEKLLNEIRDNLLIVICDGDQDDAIAKLEAMGYGREHYILCQELFFNPDIYQKIRNRKISIWGTGGSYFCYEEKIKEYLPEIADFFVTEKTTDTFQGKNVFSLSEIRNRTVDSYIVVVSIYYKEIYNNLIQIGLHPGKDFLHINTVVMLGKLATRVQGDYPLENRQSGSKELLLILSGYKESVWESVFGRVQAFVPEGIDVCVITSGLVNNYLKGVCTENDWSYLSTSRNNISLALNLAVSLHPGAEYIYKMDEDIFVTDGVFETMKSTYLRVESESRYRVGFVSPLIPVNGYSYVRLLEIFDAVDLWEERFGALKHSDCCWNHRTIQGNPKAARFMWGDGNPRMANLDHMQKVLKNRPFQYSICPIRYSIGFILFHREIWLRMGMFPVLEYLNIGVDEEHFCQFCMMQGKAMVIAENAIAGHLSFGPQNEEMEEYYSEHKEKFLL